MKSNIHPLRKSVLAAIRPMHDIADVAMVYHSGSVKANVQPVDRRLYQRVNLAPEQLAKLSHRPHRWWLYVSVFMEDGRTETNELRAVEAYTQAEIIPLLKQEHGRLIQEHVGEGVLAVGWIAAASGTGITPEEADRLYLAALNTENRLRLFDHYR